MNKSKKEIIAKIVNGKKSYGKGETLVKALNGVSLSFNKGEFISIMGPSGSGKSTLLQCIAGLDTLTSGKTYIDGTELGSIKDKKLTVLRREKVGFIFQSFNLIPSLTAEENIKLPSKIAGEKADQGKFNEIVNSLGIASRVSHLPTELSGGERQRVAAARALVSSPAIIFADEPSGNLDSNSGDQLLSFMREAVDKYNQAIVMVTHDPRAASYTDKTIFIDDGKIVDEMRNPTLNKILDRLKTLEAN